MSGNPSGRPAGKKTLLQSNTLLLLKAESLGKGAAPFLRGVYNCPQAPDQLRATAAIALLPYENVRCTDKRVSRPIDMPRSTTVEQCLENIAELKDGNFTLRRDGFFAIDAAICRVIRSC